MRRLSLLGLLILLVTPASAAPPTLTRLRVYPPVITLDNGRDRQSFVVQAEMSDGTTRDVTGLAKVSLANPKTTRLTHNVLRPLADGKNSLLVRYAGQQVSVPVLTRSSKVRPPISFLRDVMPVLAKGGCNVGGCHGAANGRDGFGLSLFGFDPRKDHDALTRQQPGRRINLAFPRDSLLLQKATGQVRHTGGKRFAVDSEYFRTLERWVSSGAPGVPAKPVKPISVELLPPKMVLEGAGTTQQLVVRARFSDGTDRDVTSTAVFLSNNTNSATVSPSGKVTAHKRGEAFVMIRFASFNVTCQVLVIPKGLKFTFPSEPETHYIDRLVNNKLRKLRVAPSGVCNDHVYLRRVHLDVIGRLPTTAEYRAFARDKRADKRARLVDALLQRKEFVELWVLKWAERLQVRSSNRISYKAMWLYYNWLEKQIAGNVPIDKMVQELLGVQGSNFTKPASNYYQNEQDAKKIAENIAQVFLGMRIQCAQCHNHPFDRWTQDDYYSFAAFFTQIGRKRGQDPRETITFNRRRGEIRHPVTKRNALPKFLGGIFPKTRGKDRRIVVAEWLASSKNPYFAPNLANMVWEHFFGLGIVHEVDDARVSNPPSNPELLAELGKRFTGYKYDFKKLVRDICTSRAYQRATRANASNKEDTRNFSHARIRRIRAEVLQDCINLVTGTTEKFRGLPRGSRAVQIADGRFSTYFLRTFGRPKRDTVCSCEVKMEPTLSQALHLLNGDTVQRNIVRGNLIGRQLKKKRTPRQILRGLYIRCLSRPPSKREQQIFGKLLDSSRNKKRTLEDLFWALINSREFIFNH